jgi:hypothetical protein
MEFTEVDKKVIRGIRHAVDARGEDWRYPNGKVDRERLSDFTPDPAWTNGDGGCYNLLLNGDPACIIGFCAVDQGLPTVRSSSAWEDASNWRVSRGVERAMIVAQTTQDNGYTWGVAWSEFVNTLLDGGYAQEQIDAALQEGN